MSYIGIVVLVEGRRTVDSTPAALQLYGALWLDPFVENRSARWQPMKYWKEQHRFRGCVWADISCTGIVYWKDG